MAAKMENGMTQNGLRTNGALIGRASVKKAVV